MKRKNIGTWILAVILAALVWDGIVTGIQAIKCPEMTQTELFLHAFKSMALDFKDCE